MSKAKKKRNAIKMRNQPPNVGFPSNGQADQEFHLGPSMLPAKEGCQKDVQTYFDQPTTKGYFKGRGGYHPHLQTPKFITATRFAQARAEEMRVMLKTVSRKSSNSQLFHTLPRHMRRRAMGHDIKRLPRRLREMAKKEMDKVVHQKKEQSKSKCRKARRRHRNLQIEFNRRQLKNIWLETHIWHAKRFHMVKKWGYCLGDRATTKCYRACFRAMTSECLLQDISYYCCLELFGKEDELLKALAPLCNSDAGPTFAATQYLSGKRQGALILYRKNKYPLQVLGPITFIWKPRSGTAPSSEIRQLWIWAHPTLKPVILAELRDVCQCAKGIVVPDCVGKKRKRTDEGDSLVRVKKILGDGTRDPLEHYSWDSASTGITISDLTMEIVRYRLIGPLSNCVLAEALKTAVLHKEIRTLKEDPHTWWTEYCKDVDNVSCHARQAAVFQLLQAIGSPAEVPSGTVLGLTTGDPRVNLPKKRSIPRPDLKSEDKEKARQLSLEGASVECARSLLWNEVVRKSVTENKISEQEINRLRRELLVPGSKLELGVSESKIPVLIIQQPGRVAGDERRGWGAGWDICLPKGWGMAFWMSFIYRGARIGGLKEGFHHSLCKGTPHIPNDFPDCPAGVQTAKELETRLLEKFNRRPPAKRTNYVKHGSVAPFLCPWKQLTHNWEAKYKTEAEGASAKVLGGKICEEGMRMSNHCKLQQAGTATIGMDLTETLDSKDATSQSTIEKIQPAPAEDTDEQVISFCVLRCRRLIKQLSYWCRPSQKGRKIQQELTAGDVEPLICLYPRTLVWVRLSLMKKGTPEMHAMICIPLQEDLMHLRKDGQYSGPQEPKHSDHFKHNILKLKKLKRKKKSKHTISHEGVSVSTAGDPNHEDADPGALVEQTKENIGEMPDLTLGLWPEPLPDVSSHCSRMVLGFVTQGDFSLAVGCGEAVGFVSLTGLLHMLARQPIDRKGTILVRNPASLQYRFAELTIDI
ncbi:ribonucleases P/MRP protein subunit POP1 [Ambystoma mexicanum]|uniref:ribonucleases P/MRP protein subunit POP1 n=1 Tax=Ambystoma mexicanum TaxID=8296 RepID=UPI0037E8C997